MQEERKVLEMVLEKEILGKKIKMYGSIEFPWFVASDVAEWIDYSKLANGSYQVSMMVKKIDDEEKAIKSFYTLGGIQESWALTEDGLYECCMRSTKPIAKEMKKEIKKYLKSIRLTGAAVPVGSEELFVQNYLPSLSGELKDQIIVELSKNNKELQNFYDRLMNTEGLMPINRVAKELEIGEYKLFEYLRRNKIFFYDKDKINIPYERFRKEGKFAVKETPCQDGTIRAVTYATKKGLEYIRKLLTKDGYYTVLANGN